MKKNLAALALVSALVSGSAFAADSGSGDIHFYGVVNNGACEIDTSNPIEVDLGSVPVKKLSDASAPYGSQKNVPIRLLGCKLADGKDDDGNDKFISKVQVTFNGQTDATKAALISNMGNAKGVGVRMINSDGALIEMNGDAAARTSPEINLPSQDDTPITLNFAARMEATGATLVPGSVDANATYTLSYK